MGGLAEDESCRFRPPKSVQEEDSLLVQSKPKSTQYKDKWAVEVFRISQAAREQKFCILDPGSMFKDYLLDRVQSLKEKLGKFDLGPNFIKFEENLCKTFHGGLTDLKYVPKRIKHICHNVGGKHNPCLLEVYRMWSGRV